MPTLPLGGASQEERRSCLHSPAMAAAAAPPAAYYAASPTASPSSASLASRTPTATPRTQTEPTTTSRAAASASSCWRECTHGPSSCTRARPTRAGSARAARPPPPRTACRRRAPAPTGSPSPSWRLLEPITMIAHGSATQIDGDHADLNPKDTNARDRARIRCCNQPQLIRPCVPYIYRHARGLQTPNPPRHVVKRSQHRFTAACTTRALDRHDMRLTDSNKISHDPARLRSCPSSPDPYRLLWTKIT